MLIDFFVWKGGDAYECIKRNSKNKVQNAKLKVGTILNRAKERRIK
jgi:hypothetical protein